MSCKTLQLNKFEIKGSTFSGRKFIFKNRNIANDKFKVVGYSHVKSSALFTIDGIIIDDAVYFSYSQLEEFESGSYILKFWAEFKDLATELIAIENFKISTTPCCDSSSTGNNEFTLNFGEEIIDYELSITGSKGAPFTYEDFTQEQITDLKQPAIDASVVALDKAEKASMAADLANEKAGLANQSAINANSATTAATTATQNANTATTAANNATQQSTIATQESVTATENANRVVGQANEVISSATLATNNANTAAQNAIAATEGAVSASQNAITSTENSIIKTNEAIQATSEAIQATENANEAARNTLDATSNANTATQNANEAASNANAATQNTVNAIIEANTATQSANTAAQVANNAKGWTPVFRFENDGDTRQVNKLVGYVGGTGSAPTDNVGSYVKESGYTLIKSDASNFKGAAGNLNAASDIILSGAISKTQNSVRVFNKVFQNTYLTAQTGILSLKFPQASISPTIFEVDLKIYSYNTNNTSSLGVIRVSFYKMTATEINTIAGKKGLVEVSDNFPTDIINIGIDLAGNVCINIGAINTILGPYLSLEVERVKTKYTGFNADWSKGWSTTVETVNPVVPDTYKSLVNVVPDVASTRTWVASQLASYVTQSALNTQLGNYATLNGVQTFTNTKSFQQSPIVPNGTLSTHAVNLSQLQQYSRLPSVQLITATTSTIAFDNLLMRITMQNGGTLNVSSVLVNQEIIISNPSNTTLVINFTSLSLSYTLAAKSVVTFEVLTGNKLLRRSVVESGTLLMN